MSRGLHRGVTLIDTIVGISLMLVIFLGIFAAFTLSVDVVTNNKARAGAIALSDERMEYIRSLSYASIGTVGGIPSGLLAQTEAVSLNGISYTRRTLVEYADDPKDGTGASDSNGITTDYKIVKVDVSWQARNGTRDISLVTRFEPETGLETSVSGGTLTINVLNANSQPVSNAQVTITNAGSSPAVNLTTYSNTDGVVSLLGAPAASGYSVAVSKSGYSSAQTYTASGQNTNPSPANLTVSNGQSTASTFAIDLLASETVITLAYGTGNPMTTVPVTMRGAKTIGTNPVVYKYSAIIGGSGSATTTLPNLEWDTYTFSVASTTGYDLASSCSPQPVALAPASSITTTLYLAPHTASSLPVKVAANSTGALIPGASVRLYKAGYDVTQSTDSCGQTFFSGLTTATYSMSVSAPGYTTYTNASVSVGATTAQYSVSLQ